MALSSNMNTTLFVIILVSLLLPHLTHTKFSEFDWNTLDVRVHSAGKRCPDVGGFKSQCRLASDCGSWYDLVRITPGTACKLNKGHGICCPDLPRNSNNNANWLFFLKNIALIIYFLKMLIGNPSSKQIPDQIIKIWRAMSNLVWTSPPWTRWLPSLVIRIFCWLSKKRPLVFWMRPSRRVSCNFRKWWKRSNASPRDTSSSFLERTGLFIHFGSRRQTNRRRLVSGHFVEFRLAPNWSKG